MGGSNQDIHCHITYNTNFLRKQNTSKEDSSNQDVFKDSFMEYPSLAEKNYYVQKFLGKKENIYMFQIYHALWETSVHLKMVDDFSKENKKSLTKEAYQWIALGMHPNIVSAYFLRDKQTQLYLLLEPVLGKKLSAIQLENLSFVDLLTIVLEIANGLAYLHKNNVVWGNVMPENIILAEDGRIRLTNIRWQKYQGLENLAQGLQSSLYPNIDEDVKENMKKRMMYLPPEYFLQPHFTPTLSSDIYSFGVLLYELFVQKPPYPLDCDFFNLHFIYSYIHRQGNIYANLENKDLQILIHSCMEKDPLERPQSMNNIIRILKRIYKETINQSYIFELWPENVTWAMALNNQALGFIERKEFESAKNIFRTIHRWDMNNITAPLNAILLQWKQKEISFQEFFQMMKKYRMVNPLQTLYILGKACLEEGSFIEQILQWIKEENRKELNILQADLCYRLEYFQQACELYKQETMQHDTQMIWYKYGASLGSLKLSRDAIAAWETGLTKQMPIYSLCMAYGLMMASMGQYITAQRHLLKHFTNNIQYLPIPKPHPVWSHVRTLKSKDLINIVEATISQDKRYILGRNNYGNTCIWEWPSGRYRSDTPKLDAHNFGKRKKTNQSFFIQFLDIAITSDVSMAITANGDEIARLWNLQTLECIQEWKGHTAPITKVLLTPDGSKFISGSLDNTIRIWQKDDPNEKAKLLGHTDAVIKIAIATNGRYLASASWDKTIRVWDLEKITCLGSLSIYEKNDVAALGISSDGKYVVCSHGGERVHIWDFEQKRQISIVQGNLKPVSSIFISDDSQLILTASKTDEIVVYANLEEKFCAMYAQTPYLFSTFPPLDTLQERQNLLQLNKKVHMLLAKQQPEEAFQSYQKLMFLQKDMHVPEISPENTAEFAKFLQEQQYQQTNIENSYLIKLLLHKDKIACFFTNQDFCYVFTKNGVGEKWHLGTGTEKIFWNQNLSFTCFTHMQAKKTFYLGDNEGIIHVWQEDNDTWSSLENTYSPVTYLKLTPDNTILLCGHEDGTVDLWDIQSQQLVHSYQHHKAMITNVHQYDNILYTASLDKIIHMLNVNNNTMNTINTETSIIKMAGYQEKDIHYLIVACIDGSLRQYNPNTSEYIQHTISTSPITAMYKRTKSPLVLLGMQNGTLLLYNIQKQKILWKEESHQLGQMQQVYLTPDHEWFFSLQQEEALKIWKITWNWQK